MREEQECTEKLSVEGFGYFGNNGAYRKKFKNFFLTYLECVERKVVLREVSGHKRINPLLSLD